MSSDFSSGIVNDSFEDSDDDKTPVQSQLNIADEISKLKSTAVNDTRQPSGKSTSSVSSVSTDDDTGPDNVSNCDFRL